MKFNIDIKMEFFINCFEQWAESNVKNPIIRFAQVLETSRIHGTKNRIHLLVDFMFIQVFRVSEEFQSFFTH